MLTGKDQKHLAAELLGQGLGETDLGKWERNEESAPPLLRAQARTLSDLTGLPAAWFLEEDLTKVFGPSEADAAERLSRLETVVGSMNEAQGQILERLAELDDADDSTRDSANARTREGRGHEGQKK